MLTYLYIERLALSTVSLVNWPGGISFPSLLYLSLLLSLLYPGGMETNAPRGGNNNSSIIEPTHNSLHIYHMPNIVHNISPQPSIPISVAPTFLLTSFDLTQRGRLYNISSCSPIHSILIFWVSFISTILEVEK